jgi:hypothetical protein
MSLAICDQYESPFCFQNLCTNRYPGILECRRDCWSQNTLTNHDICGQLALHHSQFGRMTCATNCLLMKSHRVLSKAAFVTHRQRKLILSFSGVSTHCATVMGEFVHSDSHCQMHHSPTSIDRVDVPTAKSIRHSCLRRKFTGGIESRSEENLSTN